MGSWLVGLMCALVAVQEPRLSVVGTVRDARSGEPISGAAVALFEIGRVVFSDSLGRYEVRSVPPGFRHITVRYIGYTPRSLRALVPDTGVLEINIALRSEPHRLPRSEIRPRVAVRDVGDADTTTYPNRDASFEAIANHPLLSEPDAFLGVTGGEVMARPELPGGMHLRGGAEAETAYLLDGVPVFSPYHVAGIFSAWNPDALERMTVVSAAPSPVLPDALSGIVSATTRKPTLRTHARGSVSTTQARMTVDGRLPRGIGYMVSGRTSFPRDVVSPRERDFLQGRSGDGLMKLEIPFAGGGLHLLTYSNDDAVDVAAAPAEGGLTSGTAGRHVFAWAGRSTGARWTRSIGASTIDVLGWVATADADAVWLAGGPDAIELASDRRDSGVSVVLRRAVAGALDVGGLRVQQSRTAYHATSGGPDRPLLAERASTPLVTVFASRQRELGARVTSDLGISASALGDAVYVGPRLQLRWTPVSQLALSASVDRSHQFAQSLRNSESVFGIVFPADLYLGAGGGTRIPVARSDRAVIATELRPTSTARLGAQAFARALSGLALVAPQSREPFATSGWITGTGYARGFSFDASVSGARYGLVASYGWQRVRISHAGSSYTPGYAPEQTIDAGIITTPTPTTSVRVGATATIGRRSTPLSGAVEWEACNLIDRGCELAGNPREVTERIGAVGLPAYARVDLSARKTWHVRFGDRDAVLAGFATVTNVFDRRNVLEVLENAPPGTPAALSMRPLSPLVVGLDWAF